MSWISLGQVETNIKEKKSPTHPDGRTNWVSLGTLPAALFQAPSQLPPGPMAQSRACALTPCFLGHKYTNIQMQYKWKEATYRDTDKIWKKLWIPPRAITSKGVGKNSISHSMQVVAVLLLTQIYRIFKFLLCNI